MVRRKRLNKMKDDIETFFRAMLFDLQQNQKKYGNTDEQTTMYVKDENGLTRLGTGIYKDNGSIKCTIIYNELAWIIDIDTDIPQPIQKLPEILEQIAKKDTALLQKIHKVCMDNSRVCIDVTSEKFLVSHRPINSKRKSA